MNFGIKKNKKLIYNEIIEFKVLNGKKSRPADQTATRVLLLKSRFFSPGCNPVWCTRWNLMDSDDLGCLIDQTVLMRSELGCLMEINGL